MQKEEFPKIMWEKKGDLMSLNFDGIPYIFLGKRDYQCHQGSDRGKRVKEKYQKLRDNLMLGDHPQAIKRRKLIQTTKKLNCPVQFSVKKIIKFPKFAIKVDTKWNRKKASTSLRKHLTDGVPVDEELQFLTVFPSGKNISYSPNCVIIISVIYKHKLPF